MEENWGRSVFWVYPLLLADDHPLDAVSFAAAMKAEGVETRPFFLGMHEQPVFHDMGLFLGETYPVTERIARKGLYIPIRAGDHRRADGSCLRGRPQDIELVKATRHDRLRHLLRQSI